MKMVKIDYLCDILENQLPLLYTLLQVEVNDMVHVCVGNQLVGTINKVTDGWQQIGGGSKMPEEFVEDLGNFLELQFANAN